MSFEISITKGTVVHGLQTNLIMKTNGFLKVLMISLIPTIAMAKTSIRSDKYPIEFINSKAVLINQVLVNGDGKVSPYSISVETVEKLIQALSSTIAIAKNFTKPTADTLQKIVLSWNVNDDGVYNFQTKSIEFRDAWGQDKTLECKEANDVVTITDKQRIAIIVHEFAHAIFHENIKKIISDYSKVKEFANGYNEMFADSLSVLVSKDLLIEKGCDNQRSFLPSPGIELLSEAYAYRGAPQFQHVVFDPVRIAFGELILKNKLPIETLARVLFDSIVDSVKPEIKSGQRLPYIERNQNFIKNLNHRFDEAVSNFGL